MSSETPREAFSRLCGEMGVSGNCRMTRAEIYGLADDWFLRIGYTRVQALQLVAARERMEADEREAAGKRSLGVHQIWAAANERLLAQHAGNGGNDVKL